jgi:hypothetical protein
MSLVVVPTSTGYPTGGYSLPERVSFAISDTDGTGGTIYINGQGVKNGDVAGAYDLKDIFVSAGLLFSSTPLLGPFRLLKPGSSLLDVQNQLLKGLSFSFYGVTANAPAPLNLRFGTLNAIGGQPDSIPFLEIIAPNGGEGYTGDTWRIDINLRHSITN